MLTHPTLSRLRELRLLGMAKAFEEQLELQNARDLGFEERLALLIDRESSERDHRRYLSRLRNAKLKQQATIEDIDFKNSRGLDSTLVRELSSCQWIKDHRNLFITGPTGVGKTFFSTAFAHQACRQHLSARYTRTSRLFQELTLAKGDGRFLNLIEKLAKTDLLVLDDWGLEPLTDQDKHILLELLDDRYQKKSTLIASQLPTTRWHDFIDDPTLADAILDRLIHNAYRIELKGESMRKTQQPLTPKPDQKS